MFAAFTTVPEAVLPARSNRTQVHGACVHVLSPGDGDPETGDGLWTGAEGMALSVRAADCVPILLWDEAAGAVGAVHAGWRGTAADIAAAALGAGARLGVRPEHLRAALGPSIGAECYEVGPEVVQSLRALGLDDQQFGLRPGAGDRAYVDVRRANVSRLVALGVDPANIEVVGPCTSCDPAWPSFRREGARAGRLRAYIRVGPA